MSALVVFCILLFLFLLCRFLNVNGLPLPPKLVCCDTKFLEVILKFCPHLTATYYPVRIWGCSGHIQTIVHATVGRTYCPNVPAKRMASRMEDGATITWDLYNSNQPSQFDDLYTICICPGIANSSESLYVRSLVSLALADGFKCIVLNHLGVLPQVPVTSPRVFRYGKTDEVHLMITKYLEMQPESKLILVGFSMGGNIICKYLGEQRKKSPNIMGAISICQGYDAVRMIEYLLCWANLARVYLFAMTENMRSVVIKHKEVLLTEDVKKRHNIDERKVWSAATLPELDESYTRKVHGFNSVEELYRSDSSGFYLKNIAVPIVMLNAKDDPIVHPDLLQIPEFYANTRKNTLHIQTDHGGHLGFYDGGYLLPNPVTWLDRTILGLVIGLVMFNGTRIGKEKLETNEGISSDEERGATAVY